MSDYNVKNSLLKAIELMERKLKQLDESVFISNDDVAPLTQIARTLTIIDKQGKDYKDPDEDISNLTPEEIDSLAEKLKKELK